MTPDASEVSPVVHRWVRVVAFTVFLAALGAVVWYGDAGSWSVASLRDWVDAAGVWAPVVYVLFAVVAAVFVAPATAVMVVGALLFSPWLAWPVVWLGAVAGSVVCFSVARYMGRSTVERFLRGRLADWDKRLAVSGFKVLFVLRLSGFPPFNLMNYLAGLTRVRLRDATLATALGILPIVVVVVVLVDRIGTAPTFGVVVRDPVFWSALGVVVALALVTRLVRRRVDVPEVPGEEGDASDASRSASGEA